MGEPIFVPIGSPFTAQLPPDVELIDRTWVRYAFVFNFPGLYFPAAGKYLFHISADDAELGTLHLYAVQVRQPDTTGVPTQQTSEREEGVS